MSDIISAIYDDIAEYHSLLRHFNEEPTEKAIRESRLPGEELDYKHFYRLQDRRRKEQQAEKTR